MKLSKVNKLLVLGLIVSVSALGCKHTPPGVTQLPAHGPGTAGTSTTDNKLSDGTAINPDEKAKADANGLIGLDEHGNRSNWAANNEVFKNFTVHFDYDSATIRASEKSNIEAVATQLKSAPSSVALRVEGHCDERGTEEYNRSLGERRALALREELIRLGVASDKIDTISFGQDKPAVIGHDESAYKQNRRGEFVQLTQPQ